MPITTVNITEEPVYSDYTNDYIDGVSAQCSKCGHIVESCGTSEASYRRCLAVMREECPRGEKNYYKEPRGTVEPKPDPSTLPWWEPDYEESLSQRIARIRNS